MRRKTTKEFIEEIKIKSPNIEIIGEYKNQRTRIKVRCKQCGREYMANPISLLVGCGCAKCSGTLKKTHEQFIDEIQFLNNNIEIMSNYVGSKDKLKVKCKDCGYMWETTPNHLLCGSGCKKCAGTLKKTTEQFISEMKIKHPTITVKGEYINNREKVLCECQECGKEFMGIPHAMLDGGSDCPRCNSSAGERKIRSWLDERNIDYLQEYCFDDCKEVRVLPFDFYIKDRNLVIEYDGSQHYKPNDYFGGLNGFEYTKKHDNIKTTYCNKHNIKLLRIPYFKFNQIDEILNSNLAN